MKVVHRQIGDISRADNLSSVSIDDMLKEINGRFPIGGRKLSAEEIFTFPARLSNSTRDSYGTHMGKSSLENYVNDVNKFGKPLMMSHRTGLFTFWGDQTEYSDMNVGQFFRAGLFPLTIKKGSEADKKETVGPFAPKEHFEVVELAYMQRGVVINGENNDDRINAVSGGTYKHLSIQIGFETYSWYQCDVCGNNLFDWTNCPHVPLLQYDIRDPSNPDAKPRRVLATATIEGAHQLEGSLVWHHATPLTVTYAAKAQRLYKDGKIGDEEVRTLEGAYSWEFSHGKTYSVVIGAKEMGTKPLEESTPDEISRVLIGESDFDKLNPTNSRETISSGAGPGQPEPEDDDESTEFEFETDEDNGDTTDSTGPETRQGTITAPTALQDGPQTHSGRSGAASEPAADPDLAKLIEAGRAYRDALTAECIVNRIRANGARSFNEAEYRTRLGKYSVDELIGENKDWAGRALGNLYSGRQTPIPTLEDEGEEGDNREPDRTLVSMYSGI